MPTNYDFIATISNYWQVIGLAVIGGFICFGIWITKSAERSKALIAKAEELERERTERRKEKRDAQISALEKDFAVKLREAEIRSTGLGKSFDTHKEAQMAIESQTTEMLRSVDEQLRRIKETMVNRTEFDGLKEHVHALDVTLMEVETKSNVRDAKIDHMDSKIDTMMSLLNTTIGGIQSGTLHHPLEGGA